MGAACSPGASVALTTFQPKYANLREPKTVYFHLRARGVFVYCSRFLGRSTRKGKRNGAAFYAQEVVMYTPPKEALQQRLHGNKRPSALSGGNSARNSIHQHGILAGRKQSPVFWFGSAHTQFHKMEINAWGNCAMDGWIMRCDAIQNVFQFIFG